jgi:hypothetical protein
MADRSRSSADLFATALGGETDIRLSDAVSLRLALRDFINVIRVSSSRILPGSPNGEFD